MQQWSPLELKQQLDKGEAIQLIDVREDDERNYVHIGGIHIPMGQISVRIEELDPEAVTVVYCHHGRRSAQIVGFLLQQGFSSAINLQGGIDRWAEDVDMEMKRY